MPKVLVTGGAGFIGSHVAERFLERGHEVVVFDNLSRVKTLGRRFASAASYNLEYLRTKKGKLKVVNGDVRSYEQLSAAARGADSIIHVAGQVAVTASIADPRHDFEVNALGTFNVMEAARENDACVLYTSTNKVYGENVNRIPLTESATRYGFRDPAHRKGISESFPVDLTGHSPYGASKLTGDLYVQEYAHSYGLPTTVFRMSCIYGERQFGMEEQGWVAWFVIAALSGKPITIYGNGKQVRDILYVKDLVGAIELALSGRWAGEVFNIGGGTKNALSLLELLNHIRDLPGCRIRTKRAGWRKSDQKVYVSDITRASMHLNWTPSTKAVDGVRKLYDWVSDNVQLFTTVSGS